MKLPYSCAFVIRDLPKLPRELLRAHWTTVSRHANDWKVLVHAAIPLAIRPEQPLRRASIEFVRHSAAKQGPDYDNLVASFKPVLDGLIVAGVIMDDSPVTVDARYRWEKAKRGHGRIGVSILEEEPIVRNLCPHCGEDLDG